MLNRFKSAERRQLIAAFIKAAAGSSAPFSYRDLYAIFRQTFDLGPDVGNDIYIDVAYRFHACFLTCLRMRILKFIPGVNKTDSNAFSAIFVLTDNWREALQQLTDTKKIRL